MASFFEKLKQGIAKTRNGIVNSIRSVIKSFQKIDEELLEEIEEILISADVGTNTTMQLMDDLREKILAEKIKNPIQRPFLIRRGFLKVGL